MKLRNTRFDIVENLYPRLTKGIGCRACALVKLTAWLGLSSMSWAQAPNPGLETFQRFTNGKEPVKEAVVYRKITRQDGKLVNQEWVRFGWQEGSWYAQRVTPDTNDPSKMVPAGHNVMCGASFSQLWTVSEDNLHVADKATAFGSVPERYAGVEHNMIVNSLSLGVPTIEPGDLSWEGTNFTTSAVTRRSPNQDPIETNTLDGSLVLGADGMPVSLEYSGRGDISGGEVTYEYGHLAKEIPTVFAIHTRKPNGIVRYEFLSLALGKVDLSGTDGYVPAMFAEKNASRGVTLWSNRLAYTLRDGETFPAFETTNPRRTGSLIFGAVVVAIVAFPAWWYLRSKKRNQQTKKQKG